VPRSMAWIRSAQQHHDGARLHPTALRARPSALKAGIEIGYVVWNGIEVASGTLVPADRVRRVAGGDDLLPQGRAVSVVDPRATASAQQGPRPCVRLDGAEQAIDQ